MTRIAVGGFLHETNTFAPTKATYDAFVHGGGWPGMKLGDYVLKSIRNINVGLAGFIDDAEAKGWDLVPTIWCAASPSALPPEGLPEIAFVGRSNVGKSSLVNALTGRRTLARISNTPGRTRQINFFNLGGKLTRDEKAAGKPGRIKRDDYSIEVMSEGTALDITVKDDWDKTVRIRLPRALVESFGGKGRITTTDILKKLDELGPGDMVVVKDRDKEVTITAEAR